MATTDPSLAVILLTALERLGVRYAVLHREADIAAENIESDIDILIDRSPAVLALELASAVEESGLGVVMVWPYDIASMTTFWMKQDCTSGVQLDLIYDPTGSGKYGLRTGIALKHTERGERWVRLEPEAERVYLLSKREYKKQLLEAGGLVANSSSRTQEIVNAGLLSDKRARIVRQLLSSEQQLGRTRWSQPRGMLTWRRLWNRWRNPIGVLIMLKSKDQMIALRVGLTLAEKLSGVLVHSSTIHRMKLRYVFKYGIAIRRPFVLIVTGSSWRTPTFEIELGSFGEGQEVYEAVWRGLQTCAIQRLRSQIQDAVT